MATRDCRSHPDVDTPVIYGLVSRVAPRQNEKKVTPATSSAGPLFIFYHISFGRRTQNEGKPPQQNSHASDIIYKRSTFRPKGHDLTKANDRKGGQGDFLFVPQRSNIYDKECCWYEFP